MKLPNFHHFAALNELRIRMGIPSDVYGSFVGSISARGDEATLSGAEQEKLESGEGIEVSFDDLKILPDGTFAFKDSRVLLYIRDVHVHGDPDREPRYHLFNCTTIENMDSIGRFHRYVIATEMNGVFKLNIISDGHAREERRALSVCQNCLAGLKFDGFGYHMLPDRKRAFVRAFRPEHFFLKYPRSLHARTPSHDNDTAPVDNYPADWREISLEAKRASRWTCDKCKNVLASYELRRFLDVHHRDGNRANNWPSNLRTLCVGCHSQEPHHHHMRNDPRYAAYARAVVSSA